MLKYCNALIAAKLIASINALTDSPGCVWFRAEWHTPIETFIRNTMLIQNSVTFMLMYHCTASVETSVCDWQERNLMWSSAAVSHAPCCSTCGSLSDALFKSVSRFPFCQLQPKLPFSSDRSHQQGVSNDSTATHFNVFCPHCLQIERSTLSETRNQQSDANNHGKCEQ